VKTEFAESAPKGSLIKLVCPEKSCHISFFVDVGQGDGAVGDELLIHLSNQPLTNNLTHSTPVNPQEESPCTDSYSALSCYRQPRPLPKPPYPTWATPAQRALTNQAITASELPALTGSRFLGWMTGSVRVGGISLGDIMFSMVIDQTFPLLNT
jgi:hypothetical protein